MRSFKVLGAPTGINHPSWGALEQTGAQSNSKIGPFGDYGPLGHLYGGAPVARCTRLEK